MPKHVRSPLVAVVAIVVASALAACGGNDQSVDSLLNQTFGGSKSVKSGRLAVSFNLNARGISSLKGPVSLGLRGPFESQGDRKLPKFDLTLSVSTQGRNFNAGATSTGDQGFIRLQNASYAVPADVFARFKSVAESQANTPNRGGKFSLASLGIRPREWLRNARKEGDADVGGTKTIHIAADVDVGRLLDDVNTVLGKAGSLGATAPGQVPGSITPQQRQQVERAVKSATVDVYTGKDDKILRRLSLRFSFQVPASARGSAGGLQSGDVALDVEVDDVNQSQDIRAPASPRPFAELAAAVRGLGSSGGAAPSSRGGGAAGASAKAQAYARCFQQAGGDVRRAQRCARLLK